MTIITKERCSDKKEETKKLPVDTDVETVPLPTNEAACNHLALSEWRMAWRRRRLLMSLCATLLILWLLMAAIVGSILLFRYLHKKPVYYGWCGTKYFDEETGRTAKLQQHVEIDPDNEFEKIEVPEFGRNRPATFVHDFKENLTAIIDRRGGQCFVKLLDRNQMAPPTSLIDLIRKVEEGYYEQNVQTIRENYQVRLPPLTYEQLTKLGSSKIASECEDLTTYQLVKSLPFDRQRRSVGMCSYLTYKFYNARGQVFEEQLERCG